MQYFFFTDVNTPQHIFKKKNKKEITISVRSPTSNAAQKVYNWETLNRKVFSKFFGFTLPKDAYTAAAFSEPGVIEKILKFVRSKLAEYQTKNGSKRALVSKSLDELQEHPEKGQWKVAASYAQRISPSYVPIKDGSPDGLENYETFHSPKSWENNYNDGKELLLSLTIKNL